MLKFEVGDNVTPDGSSVRSLEWNDTVEQGTVVTITGVRNSLLTFYGKKGLFWSYDFRRTPRSGDEAASSQTETALLRAGDKVKPKQGLVRSMDGRVGIEQKEIVTIRQINGDFFLTNEHFGIFSVFDFKAVSPQNSAPSMAGVKNASKTFQKQRVLPRDQPQKPSSRKALKKQFERETNQTLEWCDGYLCPTGTKRRVPNSPYRPKE